MNFITRQYLGSFLPPEVVVEIDDYLITIYRKENAKKCRDIVRQKIMSRFILFANITTHKIMIKDADQTIYLYHICMRCGEVVCSVENRFGHKSMTHVECKYFGRGYEEKIKKLNWGLRVDFRSRNG